MDERTRLFLSVVAGLGGFAALLGLFGAVTGALRWRQGRPAGTALGLAVARAFGRLREEAPLSPAAAGALAGGADGAVFGAVVGTAVGLLAGWQVPAEWPVLRAVFLALAGLAAAALALGAFAGLLVYLGTRALLALFAGGMFGALTGYSLDGPGGLFYGVLAGSALGVLALAALPRAVGGDSAGPAPDRD